MPLAPGTRFGHYETQSLIGAGGMGEVYRARDTKLKREVALKVLPETLRRDPARMTRFQREAEVLASLNHANIAQIYGVEDNALAMELVEGESPKGPLPFEEAWKVAAQIADALEYAHERGIAHRDLKPDNVKVSSDGVVKLLDFGLAKAFSGSQEGTLGGGEDSPTVTVGATIEGTILGTPGYMPPEQAKGKRVDKRADIWAWGVMLYELLTGDRLFQGESVADTLAQVLQSEPDLEKAPPRVRKLLRRCLQKDPRQRLRDIGDARDLLDEATQERPAAAAPARSRFGIAGWAAAAVIALIAVATEWVPWRARPAENSIVNLSMDLSPAEMLGPAPFFSRPVYTSFALSPDGKLFVYAGLKAGQLQLYRRPLDQKDAAPISGTDGAAEPFFSPDGEWIAFFAGGKLRKVPVNGGIPTDILDIPDIRSRSWGGSFGASWASNETIVIAQGRQGIVQVPASGGIPKTVVPPDPAKPGQSYRMPELLPDRRILLYTLLPFTGAEPQIIARRIDSGEQHVLIQGGADARYLPTGDLVYEKRGVLMAVPFDGKRMQVAGSPVAMIDGVMQALNVPNGAVDTGMGQFAVSRSGDLVYAPGGVSPSYTFRVVRVDRKGAETELKAPPDQYISLRVSPDGQKIAVFKGGSFAGIWLIDAISGNSIRLTSEGPNSWPVWSPDGKRILFSKGSQFEVMPADGSGAIEPVLAVKPFGFYPASWSADGTLAYLDLQDGISRIWAKPMARPAEPKLFAESKAGFGYLEVSPDGHWLVYTSNESGSTEVYVQAFPGPGGKHRISTNGGSNAAWARNGRELFYLEPRPAGKLAMMAVDFTPGTDFKAGTPHELFEGALSATTPLRSYDVSPDGQHFIMLRTQPPPDERVAKVHVVLNWAEALKRASGRGR